EASPIEREIETEGALAATSPSTLCRLCARSHPSLRRRGTSSTSGSSATAHDRGHVCAILVVARRIRTESRSTQPQIPIQRVGNGRRGRDFLHSLRPSRPAVPGMDFAHFTNLARPQNLASDARGIVRVALIPHLGCDLVLFGGLGK